MPFKFTKEEIEFILNILAQRPYIEVKALIENILEQAKPKAE